MGTASVLHWHGVLFLWVAWWSFVAALAAAVAVSLVTRPPSDDRLRGLVWFLPEGKTGSDKPSSANEGKEVAP